jgi:hypothetical protein
MPRRSGGGAGVHGGQSRKRAGRPCRRARGIGVVRKEKEKERESLAHHAKKLQRRQRAKMEQWRRHSVMAAGWRRSGRQGHSSGRRLGHEPAAREDSLSHSCNIQEEKEKKKEILHQRRA